MIEHSELTERQTSAESKFGKRRRIVHVISMLDDGGAAKQLGFLAVGLPREQFEFHVCVLSGTGPREAMLREASIPITQINRQRSLDVSAWLRLRNKLKELQPDIVHTWLSAANTFGRQAALAAGCRHLVASERYLDRWKSWYHFAIDRRLARKSDRVLANSEAVQNFLIQHRIAAKRIEVIRSGMALAEPAQDNDRIELRRQLNLPLNANVIVAVGKLLPQKRYKDLIWAADLIKCIRDDTHLLIVGEGPQRLPLQRYAEQVEILDRVHFMGHRADAEELIRRADLLWSGSESEGASNGVLEAMASGTAVIASNVDANRELIEHQEHGVLFPLGDRAALAKWTQHLIEHPEERRRMADAARARVAEEFSLDHMLAQHTELYNRILGD